ncbi:MAG: hypothetical protein A3F17_05705 [Gammaproteobacteria bacterium RIFCSPHIGHO2_12_FULL_41_15]|nr:MAG: hypothetical protein A3F17_05705 [Gammaproteobacteria bacterium RIFCSPHIGHO2_12_FULL_41_15]
MPANTQRIDPVSTDLEEVEVLVRSNARSPDHQLHSRHSSPTEEVLRSVWRCTSPTLDCDQQDAIIPSLNSNPKPKEYGVQLHFRKGHQRVNEIKPGDLFATDMTKVINPNKIGQLNADITIRVSGIKHPHHQNVRNSTVVDQQGMVVAYYEKKILTGGIPTRHSTQSNHCCNGVLGGRKGIEGIFMTVKAKPFGLEAGGDFLFQYANGLFGVAAIPVWHPKLGKVVSSQHSVQAQLEMAFSYKFLSFDRADIWQAYQNRFNPAWHHALSTGCVARLFITEAFASVDACWVFTVMLDMLRNQKFIPPFNAEQCESFLRHHLTGANVQEKMSLEDEIVYWLKQVATLKEKTEYFYADTFSKHLTPAEIMKINYHGEGSPREYAGTWVSQPPPAVLDEQGKPVSRIADTSSFNPTAEMMRDGFNQPNHMAYWTQQLETLVQQHPDPNVRDQLRAQREHKVFAEMYQHRHPCWINEPIKTPFLCHVALFYGYVVLTLARHTYFFANLMHYQVVLFVAFLKLAKYLADNRFSLSAILAAREVNSTPLLQSVASTGFDHLNKWVCYSSAVVKALFTTQILFIVANMASCIDEVSGVPVQLLGMLLLSGWSLVRANQDDHAPTKIKGLSFGLNLLTSFAVWQMSGTVDMGLPLSLSM